MPMDILRRRNKLNILSSLILFVCLNAGLPINEDVTNLLLETCAVESDFGKYDKQLDGGPARGIFQMEPNTAWDIIDNYVDYRPNLYKITDPWLDKGLMDELLLNAEFSIIMTRIHYLRVNVVVPSTRLERAHYWVKYYNCGGKGTIEKYMEKTNRYLGENI